MTAPAFTFEIPLEYYAWLTAEEVLYLVQDRPLSLPSDPDAASDAIRYEQAFPVAPARDKNPARAQVAETLIRNLWDRQARTGLQEQLRGLKHTMQAAREAGEDPTLRISAKDPRCLNAAIALIQACQQELGAPPVDFLAYHRSSSGLKDAEAVLVQPGKDPVVFRLHLELELKFIQAMKDRQKREQYDLTDEDQRTDLVDKAVEDVIVGTPLHDRMVETALEWGQEQSAQRTAAAGLAP